MRQVLANYTASITELKRNPTALIREAENSAIAILNHNRPTAYLIPAAVYEKLLECLEDYELGKIVKQRESQKPQAKEVSLNDL